MQIQMLIQIKHQAGQPQIEIFTLTCILFTIELISVNNRFAYDAFYVQKKFVRVEHMDVRTHMHSTEHSKALKKVFTYRIGSKDTTESKFWQKWWFYNKEKPNASHLFGPISGESPASILQIFWLALIHAALAGYTTIFDDNRSSTLSANHSVSFNIFQLHTMNPIVIRKCCPNWTFSFANDVNCALCISPEKWTYAYALYAFIFIVCAYMQNPPQNDQLCSDVLHTDTNTLILLIMI